LNAKKCEEIAEQVKLREHERKTILLEQTQLFASKMEHLKELEKKLVAAKHLRSDLKPGSRRHPLPMLVESLRESIEIHGWLYRDVPGVENTENDEQENNEESGLESTTNNNSSNIIVEIPTQPVSQLTNEELTIETERIIRNASEDVIVIDDELSHKKTRRN